jgi:hypothetical protein
MRDAKLLSLLHRSTCPEGPSILSYQSTLLIDYIDKALAFLAKLTSLAR